MNDLDLIKQIENELGVKLEQSDQFSLFFNTQIYVLNRNGQVTGLDLKDCRIGNLERIISPLMDLTDLTHLCLDNTKISDISPLAGLTNLTILSLARNQVSDLDPLAGFINLTELTFFGTSLSEISPLKELKLNLARNQVTDISPLKDLPLQQLMLQNNPIRRLPSWISDFDLDIEWEKRTKIGAEVISFYDNPLEIPPPEIVKQGKEAVRNYFVQLEAQEEDYLFEAKMLILGEPGAGKSSLAWKVEDPDCDLPQVGETTRGIDVRPYYFAVQKEDFAAFPHPEKLANRTFRVNLWDFGGQEIYKATHRFFLSKRSLYALVADSRNEDTDFNYWLHIVEMFGGDSPLLIVLNEKH